MCNKAYGVMRFIHVIVVLILSSLCSFTYDSLTYEVFRVRFDSFDILHIVYLLHITKVTFAITKFLAFQFIAKLDPINVITDFNICLHLFLQKKKWVVCLFSNSFVFCSDISIVFLLLRSDIIFF